MFERLLGLDPGTAEPVPQRQRHELPRCIGMRHADGICRTPTRQANAAGAREVESRYIVGLAPGVANQVARDAETVDTSMSKAIAALVRIGLESQEDRKRDFFRRLKKDLANDDPDRQDRRVDGLPLNKLAASFSRIFRRALLAGNGELKFAAAR